MPKKIARPALTEALLSKTPPIVFEVLPRKYYDTGHLPGAILLPPDEFDRVVPAHVARKDAPIVVYCASMTCQNSHQVASWLDAQGYTNVAIYEGGKQDWTEAGLRLEK